MVSRILGPAIRSASLREIAKILRRHVDKPTLERIINDLLDVPGDKTFRDNVERIAHELTKTLLGL
jgi:hypothetical protein